MAQWERYVRYSFVKTLLGGLFRDDHRIYWNTYGQNILKWKTISETMEGHGWNFQSKEQKGRRTKWTIHMRETSVPYTRTQRQQVYIIWSDACPGNPDDWTLNQCSVDDRRIRCLDNGIQGYETLNYTQTNLHTMASDFQQIKIV